MNTLERLSMIADELDSAGLTQAADIITNVMRRVAQIAPQESTTQTNEEPILNPSLNTVGQYDESAWKQAFADKYNRFVQFVQMAKDDNTPMDSINPAVAQGLYDEMMYMASNYLKDDQEVFQAMKWVLPTYKGLFAE